MIRATGFQFMESECQATLAELGLQDGDVVVVVAPRALGLAHCFVLFAFNQLVG